MVRFAGEVLDTVCVRHRFLAGGDGRGTHKWRVYLRPAALPVLNRWASGTIDHLTIKDETCCDGSKVVRQCDSRAMLTTIDGRPFREANPGDPTHEVPFVVFTLAAR